MISAQLHLGAAAAVEEGGKQGGMGIGRKAGRKREKMVGGKDTEKTRETKGGREGGSGW